MHTIIVNVVRNFRYFRGWLRRITRTESRSSKNFYHSNTQLKNLDQQSKTEMILLSAVVTKLAPPQKLLVQEIMIVIFHQEK
jgi:hypothetical protein